VAAVVLCTLQGRAVPHTRAEVLEKAPRGCKAFFAHVKASSTTCHASGQGADVPVGVSRSLVDTWATLVVWERLVVMLSLFCYCAATSMVHVA
jgi:hypothetical protein